MVSFKKVGSWWNDKSIELIEISKEGIFALHGWNGEQYNDCWKVNDNDMTLTDSDSYTIKPLYDVATLETVDYTISLN